MGLFQIPHQQKTPFDFFAEQVPFDGVAVTGAEQVPFDGVAVTGSDEIENSERHRVAGESWRHLHCATKCTRRFFEKKTKSLHKIDHVRSPMSCKHISRQSHARQFADEHDELH